jgi:hypothetical protein
MSLKVEPIPFVHEKFQNMLTHLAQHYPDWPLDIEKLKQLSPVPLFVMLQQHLGPHAAAVLEGRLLEVAHVLDPQLVPIAQAALADDKLHRYLRLFCELVK